MKYRQLCDIFLSISSMYLPINIFVLMYLGFEQSGIIYTIFAYIFLNICEKSWSGVNTIKCKLQRAHFFFKVCRQIQ